MNRKKLIMTGAPGFIGKRVLDFLSPDEWEIISVSRHASPLPTQATWCKGDVLDKDFLTQLFKDYQPEYFLHLAWYVSAQDYWTSPQNAHFAESGKTLTRLFYEAGGKRWIGAGTCAEYGNESWLDETSSLLGATPYGKAKADLFFYLKAYAEKNKKSYAWGRLFFPVGVGEPESRLTSMLIKNLYEGREGLLVDGSWTRHFTSNTWLAEAFATLLNSEANGAFDMVSGAALSMLEYGELVSSVAGGRDRLRPGSFPNRPTDIPHFRSRSKRLVEEVKFKKENDLHGEIERMLADFLKKRDSGK
jgi:nucleoside-diphosphate-sugar epimerase